MSAAPTTLGVVGHTGMAAAYMIGALSPASPWLAMLAALIYVPSAIVLGLGWRAARPHYGSMATVTGILLLVMIGVALVAFVFGINQRGDFAALGAVVAAMIVVGAFVLASGITAAVAFGGRLARDGLRGKIALWGHALVGPLGLVAALLGTQQEDGPALALVIVTAVSAGTGHAAGALAFRRVPRA